MKSKTNISVVSNTGVRRKSEVIIGDSGTHTSGDILDANAVEQLVNSKSGGSDMPIVYLYDEEESLSLEAGKLYSVTFDLNGREFILPDPSSSEFAEHVIILGEISNNWSTVSFSNEHYPVITQTKEGICYGNVSGFYRIDCISVGNNWLVTAVNVMPAIQ